MQSNYDFNYLRFYLIWKAGKVFLLYEYAPYCTEKHPISDKSEIRRRKRNSIIILFFIMLTELIIQDRQVKDIIFLACSIEVFSTLSLKDVNRMIIRTRD